MERISGTLLMSHNSITSNFFIFRCFLQSPITPIGLCKKRLLTLFLHVPIILPPINDRLTLKIFHIDSPSYPPPHLRHLAKSLPVPSGMTPTLGWWTNGFLSVTEKKAYICMVGGKFVCPLGVIHKLYGPRRREDYQKVHLKFTWGRGTTELKSIHWTNLSILGAGY